MAKILSFIIILLPLISCSSLSANKKGVEMKENVSGTVTIPAELQSFTDSILEIRLYKFDPFLADQPAHLIYILTIEHYSHSKGEITQTSFALGSDQLIDPTMHYYITTFILANNIRTHIGENEKKQGLFIVLAEKDPRPVSVLIRPVKKAR